MFELDGDVTPRILSRQEMTPQVNKDNEELENFDHFTINVHFGTHMPYIQSLENIDIMDTLRSRR